MFPEPSETLRKGSCSSPQPCPATPPATAQQLQLSRADSPGVTPREGAPQTLTLSGELQERGEQEAQVRADGHSAAALHCACSGEGTRLPAPRPKLLSDKTPLVCPSARVPPHSLVEQLPRAAVGSTRAVLSSAQASLGSPGTAAAPGTPPCDARRPAMTSARVTGGLLVCSRPGLARGAAAAETLKQSGTNLLHVTSHPKQGQKACTQLPKPPQT